LNRLRVDYSARERVGDGERVDREKGDGEIGGIDCKALDGRRWVGGDSNLFDLFHPSSFSSSSSSYTCTLLLILSSSPILYCTLHCTVLCSAAQCSTSCLTLSHTIPWNSDLRFLGIHSPALCALCLLLFTLVFTPLHSSRSASHL
jgi:hypothetical protein